MDIANSFTFYMTYIDRWVFIDTTATGIALEGLKELINSERCVEDNVAQT